MGFTKRWSREENGEVKLSLVKARSKMDKNSEVINEKDTNKGYHRKNYFESCFVVFGGGIIQFRTLLAGPF